MEAPIDMLDFGKLQTVDFIASSVPAGSTILDVGTGDGTIARSLIERGYRVTAIDANDKLIEEAAQNGVLAEQADFLCYEPKTRFDAVLFARSLHHIHPVEKAVAKAADVLTASGLLVVEDFGAEKFDEKTGIWFYGLKSFLVAGGVEQHSRGPKLSDGRIPADMVAHWREHHFGKHSIATGEEVVREIRRRCKIDLEVWVPHLYRYFVDDVTPEQLATLYAWEELECVRGNFKPLGLRVIATPDR